MRNIPTVCPFYLVAISLRTTKEEAKKIWEQDPDDFIHIAIEKANALYYKIDTTDLDIENIRKKLMKKTYNNFLLNIQGYSL